MIVIELIYNLALLVAVSVVAGFIDKRWERRSLTGKIVQGFLFGGVAMLAMMNPFVLTPGIFFDGRSVVLSLCAMFFGPLSGVIAAAMAIVMRLYLGGGGAAMGVSVIMSSFIIGAVFHHYRTKHDTVINSVYLLRFGVLVHVSMILLMIALPSDMRLVTLQTLGLTIIGIYPVATVLIGKILHDQEENFKLMRALKESDKQYKSLVTEMKQGLAVFDIVYNNGEKPADYRFILVNPVYEELTGLKGKEIIGKTILEVFPKTEEFWNEHFFHSAQTGEPVYYENHSSELNRYYQVVVFRPRSNQLALILTDITDQKEFESKLLVAKEQAEAGDRLKTAFMNNISHEIRTPLNGILGFGQMIAQPNLTDKEKATFFDILQSSVDRLINTVTDYMDISLIASGNLKVKNKSFNLDQLMKGQYAQLQLKAKEKNLRTQLLLPENAGNTFLHSDKELLRKSLSHLFNNALKFTASGSIRVGYEKMNGYIEFFIEDTGVGISEDFINRIFEPFGQEEYSNTRQYEGSGLGLPISKGIINQLGGKIWVKSQKGTGSEFRFNIPWQIVQPELELFETNDVIPVKSGKPLILIAEDDDSNYYYLQVILQRSSIDVIRARNGNEAVDLCRQNPNVILVLMDIKMPDKNGFEATRLIKSFCKDLPVIGVTAYALSGDESRVLDAGFDAYLPKPLKKSVLLATINKFGLEV